MGGPMWQDSYHMHICRCAGVRRWEGAHVNARKPPYGTPARHLPPLLLALSRNASPFTHNRGGVGATAAMQGVDPSRHCRFSASFCPLNAATCGFAYGKGC